MKGRDDLKLNPFSTIDTFTTEDRIMTYLIAARLNISSQLGTESFDDQPIEAPMILIADKFPELKNFQIKAYLLMLEEQGYLVLNKARNSIASLSITLKGQAYFSTKTEQLKINENLEKRRLWVNVYASTIGALITLLANWLYAQK